MNASITIISARGIPDGRSVFIVKGELVFPKNGRSRLSDCGSPLSKRRQSRSSKHGFSCLWDTGFHVSLVSRLCASTFWGMIDRDVGRDMFESRPGYLRISIFSWLSIGCVRLGLVGSSDGSYG